MCSPDATTERLERAIVAELAAMKAVVAYREVAIQAAVELEKGRGCALEFITEMGHGKEPYEILELEKLASLANMKITRTTNYKKLHWGRAKLRSAQAQEQPSE